MRQCRALDDRECSIMTRTVRVVGTLHRPHRDSGTIEIRVKNKTQIAACRRGQARRGALSARGFEETPRVLKHMDSLRLGKHALFVSRRILLYVGLFLIKRHTKFLDEKWLACSQTNHFREKVTFRFCVASVPLEKECVCVQICGVFNRVARRVF